MNTDPKVSGGHIKKNKQYLPKNFLLRTSKKIRENLWESGKNKGILSGQKSGNPVPVAALLSSSNKKY